MKRGFLNKPNLNLAKGGQAGPASSSSRTTNPSSPVTSDTESLAQAFQNLLRVQGLGDSEASAGSISQKLQDVLRGSSASQADLDLQKLQNERFDSQGGTKLAYGKVETVAIPKDYKPTNNTIGPLDANKTDHAADVILLTTIPAKNSNGPLDPDGHSEWIVHGPTKAKVINAPGYPQRVPKPKGTQPAFVVKSTPDMGLGVFATRDIKMDELIFAERPLLVSPRSSVGMNLDNVEKYNLKTQMAIAMMEWEKTLATAVGRMEPKDRNAFMELANSHRDDGSGPILGIIRTNGFRVGSNIYDGPEKRADGNNAYSGVIKIGSRINHSCMPNVRTEFSTPSFSFQCSALVDIKAGEQLYYAYCGVDQSVAKRQAELAPYGIVCSCPACKHATPETDKLRTEYRKIAMDYIVNGSWRKVGSGRRVPESEIEPVLQFKDALIKEGFHYSSEYKSMIRLLQNFYEGIGMEEKARPYREEYKRYKLPSEMISGFAAGQGGMVFTIPKF